MSNLPPILQALTWTLIHFVWQGAAIALGLAALRAWTPRATPQQRYASACFALLLMAGAPLVGWLLSWRRLAAVEALVPPVAIGGVAPDPAPDFLLWLLLAWTVGVAIMAVRLAGGWLSLRRTRREALSPGKRWAQRIERLVADVGLGERARVLFSARVNVPLLVGSIRPVILVPVAALTGLPPAYLEAAILHELIHLRRRDHLVNLCQLIVDTLLFYHPAVWWVSRVIRQEREHCCDAEVVELTGDRIAYARALTSLEETRHAPGSVAVAANGGSLMSRIRQIVQVPSEDSRSQRDAGWFVGLLGLSIVAMTVVALLAVTPGLADDVKGSIAWMPGAIAQWEVQFEEAAQRHGVDPDLLAIVALIESGGNPQAQSSYGARGLMQIMPKTAQLIARERGIADFEVEQLDDPKTNIDFGAWYLAQQLQNVGPEHDADHRVEWAAAAYNGGPGSVRRHLEEGAALSEETTYYKKMVTRLWRDREAEVSPAFEEWLGRGGRRLIARADATSD